MQTDEIQHTGAPEGGGRVLLRIAACVGVLALGVVGMNALARLRKPPAEAVVKERVLRVETAVAHRETVPVVIAGFGEAAPLDVVRLAAEIPARVVYVHPDFEAGEQIPKGEVLVRLDDRDYRAAATQAEASVQAYGDTIARLEKQLVIASGRLKTLSRNLALAEKEYHRVKGLFDESSVGTLTGVEAAEKAVNAARDALDLLQGQVDTYPLQIREARSQLRVAEARLTSANVNLERCDVRSPFNARVVSVAVEEGQYIAPGGEIGRLADDSVLEIQVALDSRDVRTWLQFKESGAKQSGAWFSEPEHVAVVVRWTEAPEEHAWAGALHRIVAFDRETRTVRVAVRVTAAEALSGAQTARRLPLVAGMFCSVEIAGRNMENVVRLPRWAVSFRNTVYLSVDGRLRTVAVEVARTTGDEVFVAGGLNEGDTVVVTRLVNPLDGVKLESVAGENGEGAE